MTGNTLRERITCGAVKDKYEWFYRYYVGVVMSGSPSNTNTRNDNGRCSNDGSGTGKKR